MFNFDGRDVVMALVEKMQNVIFYPDVPKSKDIKMPQTLKRKMESKCEAASNGYIYWARWAPPSPFDLMLTGGTGLFSSWLFTSIYEPVST